MISDKPEDLIKLNDTLRSEASGMQKLWVDCGRMCLTRRISSIISATSRSTTTDTVTPDTKLLNSVAVDAGANLASGLMSWVMPYEGRWFSWKPAPMQKGNEAVEEWLSACTEIALAELAASNFYDRAHEAMLDRGTFGIASLLVQEGRRNSLLFKTWDVGSYVIAEDEEMYVTVIPREFELTALQARDMFDVLPPKVAQALAANRPTEKSRYLHVIYPREDSQRQGTGPKAMPIASSYIHIDSKMVLKESGFEEMPAVVTRHLRWSEASAYGASPAMIALAEIRGVNYMELLMATLAEVQVSPRLILPQNFEGVPDLRAGGITFGGLDRNSFPQEWMTGGRVDFGLAFIERKEKAIKQAFHSNMFSLFTDRPGDMNIPHVDALQAEQLGRISPAFTSLTTGFINPVLERVFMILFRAGKLPPPPREAYVANSLGQPTLLFPRTVQTNRMSQEMERAKQGRFGSILQLAAAMTQAGQAAMDNLDGDRAIREITTDAGLRDLLVPLEERDRQRQQRAMAQQAAQQQQMLMEAARNPEMVRQVAGAIGAGEQPASQQAA